jgi:hypothetical protein
MGEKVTSDKREFECVATLYVTDENNKNNLIMSLIDEGYYVGITKEAVPSFSDVEGWWITVCKEIDS